jgi:hypothetical protein
MKIFLFAVDRMISLLYAYSRNEIIAFLSLEVK